ncbi:MAG: hypothetical protein ACK4NY_19835 [Spirosomataceae bacterium]
MSLAVQTPFTDAQLELLSLFNTKLTQSDMQELRQLLLEFKFRKLQNMIEEVSDEKGYLQKDFDNMANEHNRTPYKSYNKRIKN